MDAVELVKSKLNIVDIIKGYTQLKKAGKNYKGICPFHKEKTPSFSVSEEMQRYKCFGCGKAGDLFNFIEEIEQIDFSETLELLAAKAGVQIEKHKPQESLEKNDKELIYKANTLAVKFFNVILLNHPAAETARQYLSNRKITKETISEFKIGYAPKSWDSFTKFATSKNAPKEILKKAGLVVAKKTGTDVYDLFRDRIMIPLSDPFNKFIGFSGRAINKNDMPKYVNSPDTPVYHKQESLYGLNLTKSYIRKEGYAVLVEGHFDLISPYQNGIKNIVASAGTALSDKQVLLLKKYTDTVVLLFDGDGAGLDAALRGIDIIISNGLNVKIATIPSPYKDPDELAVKDINALKDAISSAVPVWDFYFVYVNKKYNLDDIFAKKEAFRFIKTGISKITDPVIKSEYVDKAANFFNVNKILLDSTDSSRGIPATKLALIDGQSSNATKTHKIDREDHDRNFKIYVLALTFNIGYDKIKDHLVGIESSYFEDPDLEKIYEYYVLYASDKTPNSTLFSGLRNKYPKVVHILEEIFLFNFAENLLEEDNLKAEILKSFRRLKRQYLLNKRQKLIENIKKAEVISDYKQIEDLSRELAELQSKINPLQE